MPSMSPASSLKFVVLGAGAWGTAFALHLVRVGHAVTLVPRRSEHAREMAASRHNPDYLPGMPLPPSIAIEADAEAATTSADVVLLACPVQSLRETCTRMKGRGSIPVVISLAKGLELGTHLRGSEVL